MLLGIPRGTAFDLNLGARASFSRSNVAAGSGAPRQSLGVRRSALAGAVSTSGVAVAKTTGTDVCLWSWSSRHGQQYHSRRHTKRRSSLHHATSSPGSSNQHGEPAPRGQAAHTNTNSNTNSHIYGASGGVTVAYMGWRGVGSRGRRPTSLAASLASGVTTTTAQVPSTATILTTVLNCLMAFSVIVTRDVHRPVAVLVGYRL